MFKIYIIIFFKVINVASLQKENPAMSLVCFFNIGL